MPNEYEYEYEYECKASADGLTVKLYRGEGACLLAFDLEKSVATEEFVGFSIEVKYPGAPAFGALRNRLHFNYDTPGTSQFSSLKAPFQKFRWIHVPRDLIAGEFEYRVTAQYMRAGNLDPGP